jgi:FKBP-type peptidyl-prolyl cis-trans isomerase
MHRLCILLLALPLSAQEILKTPSGLGIEMLVEGDPGTAPVPGDLVKVHYTGWLADGTKFDSSLDRQAPIQFVLGTGRVIPGWEEGLEHLNVGGKAKLHIPWNLAYGEQGKKPLIPPKADLLFEVELLEVTKGEPFRAADPAKQQTTQSGLKWEAIAEGSGDPPLPSDLVWLRCTIWTSEGKVLFSSAGLPMRIVVPAGSARLTPLGEKFLPEAMQLMKPGGSYRFEVPAALCWAGKNVGHGIDANATTVWQIDLLGTLRGNSLDPEKAKKTASGLEYEVVQEGKGKAPGPKSKVLAQYAGWIENGTEFDSSYRRGQPATFELTKVIPGWIEGLQLMKEGGIYRFRIPPALAYGEKGMGAAIPPNSTLVFEVELLNVLD